LVLPSGGLVVVTHRFLIVSVGPAKGHVAFCWEPTQHTSEVEAEESSSKVKREKTKKKNKKKKKMQ
jgi:hypothetical protein